LAKQTKDDLRFNESMHMASMKSLYFPLETQVFRMVLLASIEVEIETI
jgi:hypothetical protein